MPTEACIKGNLLKIRLVVSASIAGLTERFTAGSGSRAKCMARAASSGRTVLGSIEVNLAMTFEMATVSTCGLSAQSHIEANGKTASSTASASSVKSTIKLRRNPFGRMEN